MLCKECGTDVNSNEVFCPKCGAPLRVTADYDYIQAEIGVKVDQVMSNEPDEAVEAVQAALQNTLHLIGERSPMGEKEEAKPAPKKENPENTIAVTRTLFIKDSIFADENTPDEEESKREKDEVKKELERSYRRSRAERKERAAERARKKRNRLIIIIAAAVVVVLAVVGIILLTGNGKKEDPDAADTISCSIEDGGSYTAPLEITLWSDQDSRLVYTLDGTEPGVSTGLKYAQPIELTNEDISGDSQDFTLTVYAYKKDASIKVGEYRAVIHVARSQIAAPVFDLDAGDYNEPAYISISAPEGTTIHYTYDGSTPSLNSEIYTTSIEMKRGNNILSAIAADSAGNISEVTSAVYNLIIWSNISYDEAVGNVLVSLSEQGLISSMEPDGSGYYAVPDGGKRRVINGGTAVIDNVNYYVIQVDYLNDSSNVQATTYFGVNDQTGVPVILNRTGMTFVLA